ncbi:MULTISPECIES: imidazole glycerol phosphate synthase subunit HisH [unclassified Lentimicrobium]|uniref:imidazole glycerol phosphate synthase subunit HisH n=1 Tax=unclassified Lentimicrobium TaxID=2677434 RepID=UPI0015575615|nr:MULTISPECIES: imidazole glycerol phosphate synthase subunit HisH [unclassified Lentimicrobium]NPD45754.1 imidazole glycerol phosphate synthase subunit HisH [Lentimicrobium sp. S6]NPD86950.1 imidazole glycerol phosphate synthase subunit HisH [Lentimicrobium sp. L6]
MIAIIDYNAGNVSSVRNALSNLGCKSMVTDDLAIIKQADKVIFPGVGEASSAMVILKQKGLDKIIKSLKQPVIGICLGMQLMCQHSEEGNTDCLGIFDAKVKRFPENEMVPHMGWNTFKSKDNNMLSGIGKESDVYFVHSYYAEICDSTIASTDYILPFSAAMQKDNFYATQFHPEKSAGIGAQILKNFLEL